ncbi:cytochrome c oxidase subunit 1 [Thoreauomyces humboldtii]|nr:cytochrome c oxidase subunit 1 [Thoreauomyces humboldtii]
MAPTLKLNYFDMKGRAEAIRLACAIGGVQFEDVRFEREEWTTKLKAQTPFGQSPTMEIDGKVVSQSTPILRYVAKLANNGLYPTDAFEALKVDEYLNVLEDIQGLIRPSFFEQDADKKIAMRKALIGPDGDMTKMIKALEKAVSSSGSNGYSVGSKITIADLGIYVHIGWFSSGILDGFPTDMYTAYPKLQAIHDAVNTHPKVSEWVKAHTK